MLRTSLCMIVRNAEKTIAECLKSTLSHKFDEVIIVDTGSTDRTLELVSEVIPTAKILFFTPDTHPQGFLKDIAETWRGKIPGPFTGKHMLADFGGARQLGWETATGDYLMWLDSDDVLERGENLRQIIQSMKDEQLDVALLNYDYSSDGHGHVTMKLSRERIIRRGFARWMQPIHEVLVPIGRARYFDTVNVRHRRDEARVKSEFEYRNLKVLLNWFESKPEDDANVDPRMLFYLAMEERYIWPDQAIKHLRRYCQTSGWDEERGVARNLAGALLENAGKYDEALAEFTQAAFENLHNPDPYFGAARIAYYKKQWDKCIEWTQKGFEIAKDPYKSVLMHDPLDRTYRPHIYYNYALNAVGKVEEALKSCEEGLKWNPKDGFLLANQQSYRTVMDSNSKRGRTKLALNFNIDDPLDTPPLDIPLNVLSTFAVQLWKRNRVNGHEDRAQSLIQSLPVELQDQPNVMKALVYGPSSESISSSISPSLALTNPIRSTRVVIWTGPAWDKWSPEDVQEKGMGGSETAATHMAVELHRLGCEVVVLSDIEQEINFKGVRFIPYQQALASPAQFECEIFICSRQLAAMEIPWKYQVSFLWVHDVHLGNLSPRAHQALLKADRLLALSEWHKAFLLETYPCLHPDTVIVTRNGIDVEGIWQDINTTRKHNKLIYSSSPDRGLERLLDLWPRIQSQVPDVYLQVCYGFGYWEKSARQNNDQSLLARIEHLKERIHKIEGVYYHGSVGQKKLAQYFAEAKAWVYPTWFTETYCITALEAQAAGCVPITTDLAGLGETAKRGMLHSSPCTSPEYADWLVKTTVNALTSYESHKDSIASARQWALTQSWKSLASDWLRMFAEVQASKSVNPLPRFGK